MSILFSENRSRYFSVKCNLRRKNKDLVEKKPQFFFGKGKSMNDGLRLRDILYFMLDDEIPLAAAY